MHARAEMAMGTVVEMKVVAASTADAERALDAAFEELRRAEAIATPHDEGSELSRANARADSTFEAGPELDAMLAEALAAFEASGGAFDPVLGEFVRLWGFPDAPARPDSAAIEAVRARAPGRALRRGATPRRWTIADPRARLDLGGVAKGWAVDRAADVLGNRLGACLVNAGGDLAVRGTKPRDEPWVVGIQHPRDASVILLRLRVPPGASVATSGDYERFFEQDGVRYHHILDPATGRPARRLASATVVAPSCALADAWATAAFVLGPDEGLRRLEDHPELEGVLIEADPSGPLRVRETSGLAALRAP